MNFEKPHKTTHPIESVKCTVEECHYNTNDGGCIASVIEVVNSKSDSKTDCYTYTKRKH